MSCGRPVGAGYSTDDIRVADLFSLANDLYKTPAKTFDTLTELT